MFRHNQDPLVTDFNTFVYDEADASEESPTTMPSNKFNYVMTVNNSKLARKPYYKKLLTNHFESQFTQIMDHSTVINGKNQSASAAKKMVVLYQVFNKGSSTKREKVYNDSLEFFSLLIEELKDPVDGAALKPLWQEIFYLKDCLKHHH